MMMNEKKGSPPKASMAESSTQPSQRRNVSIAECAAVAPMAGPQRIEVKAKDLSRTRPHEVPGTMLAPIRASVALEATAGRNVLQTSRDNNCDPIVTVELWKRHTDRLTKQRFETVEERVARIESALGLVIPRAA
jgi:hypothetical protein